ncbi:ABC-2 type transport system permease protein [Cytobacillus horneckiae]|uniref:ABC transporter permease n=1 Tax=Cytobacillus horneckiae TaxID=549687 RepID=A0A2N0Z8Z9_9BACI|nr:ABC transporter permease [Cytobacillus horneckiae]MBN6887643.1 ABC transporter permease [Cytobacillus horneckiae]MCM3178700.1 ABC transporter permease [Cytobacillus horneckiae]MEC1158175.1 ABC transporter permease [Cytobacillus horneckiae]MED2940181.1 ABC transporter permease [Cytobacillus horneckiae]PKG25985.1 ABC transporter permease [Cytobacillus horneckiae]
MFNEQRLWKDRLSKRIKELSRYLKYIFNGHIVIVMVFLIGTAAYYYQEWVKGLPQDYPVSLIMAVILGLLVTYSPIYTFLEEADRVFLLPLEERLNGYFKKAIFVSFLFSAYMIIIGLAVFMPMYASVNNGSFGSFLPFLAVLLLLKILNFTIRWRVQYFINNQTHLLDSLVRFFVNGTFLYLLFEGASLIFLAIVGAILLLLYGYYFVKTKEKGLKWEYLIQSEERRMASFYRLANMFTDVPHLKERIKRRKWLDWLLINIPFAQNKIYHHLFMRTFLRSGDYLGIFIRLSLIGGAIIYFISFGMGQVIFALLFMYLTGFQILPLWKHHQNKLWLSLYPVNHTVKEKSFKGLLANILYVQSVLFTIVLMMKGDIVIGAITLIAGILFSYLYSHVYIVRKLRSSF